MSKKKVALIVLGVCLTLFVGCATLVGIIGNQTGSDSDPADNRTPRHTQAREKVPAVNARQVWADYKANEGRANQKYKGSRWLITLPTIHEIQDKGKVRWDPTCVPNEFMPDCFVFNFVELDFKDDAATYSLSKGQSITANCKFSGYELDSWLNFRDCR